LKDSGSWRHEPGLSVILRTLAEAEDKIYFVIDNIIQNVKAKKALAS